MKTRVLGVLIAIALLSVFGNLAVRDRTQDSAHARASVAATIAPLADIARHLAPDSVDVIRIIDPGSSPHTFEPTPSVIRTLQNSVAVYAIGHGLDDWAADLVQEDRPLVYVDAGIRLIQEGGTHEDEGMHTDPHYWLDVRNGMKIADTISADLMRRFPEQSDEIKRKTAAYLLELSAAQEEVAHTLSEVSNKNIITFHDAWYYFADAYGLNLVGSFEPTAGREPTPQYLAALTNGLRDAGTTTIYSEPEFGTAGLVSFAKDNRLKIVELDPLGGAPGRETYIDMMRFNASQIANNQ